MASYIECVLDLGTSKWVAAYAIYKDGQRKTRETPLVIADRAHEVPVIATWVEGEFKEGFELEDLAATNRRLSNKIINHHKLGFYEGRETMEHNRRVQEILDEIPGNKTLDDLTTEHLRAIKGHIESALLHTEDKKDYSEAFFRRMISDARFRITVPQIWSPKARRRLQLAAKNAGFRFVVLAQEQQCAMSYLFDKWARKRERLERPLKKGDSILVADLGCGTGDFAAYELEEDLDTQTKVNTQTKVTAVEHSTGGICGSLQVDLLLYAMLKKQKGPKWREETTDLLGLTDRDFDRRALQAIEDMRKKFSSPYAAKFGIIAGTNGESVPIKLDGEQIQDAFDKVISDITKRLDKHIEIRKPQYIEVTGGFAKSGYLMKKLRSRYEMAGIHVVRPNETDAADCFPVAVGGLIRYDHNRAPTLPSQFGYALLERQPFDPQVHFDSFEDGDLEGDDIILKSWVRADPFHPDTEVVDDRLRTIIEKGQTLLPQQVVRKEVPQIYTIPMVKPHISAELVYLTRKFKDNSAARKLLEKDDTINDDEREFRSGVFHWASVNIPIKPSQMKNKGFRVVTQGKEKEKFWEVRALVCIKNGPQDMEISFDILKPKSEQELDSEDEDSDDAFKGDVAFTATETIWDAKHSEFMHEEA